MGTKPAELAVCAQTLAYVGEPVKVPGLCSLE